MRGRFLRGACGVLALAAFGAAAADINMHHQIRYLGPACTVTGMSNSGVVIGTWQDHETTRGWVWVPGGGMQFLPLLPGSTNAHPLAVNDLGLIVGRCDEYAAAWSLVSDGSIVKELPGLRGGTAHAATAVNNLGDIVGYSVMPGEGERAVLFDAFAEAIDLGEKGFAAVPQDISDSRVVVGGSLRMSIESWRLEDLGRPHGFAAATLIAVNSNNDATGFAQLVTPIENSLLPVRYTDAGGWTLLSDVPGAYSMGHDINEAGEVVFSDPPSIFSDKHGAVRLTETFKARTDPESWVIAPQAGMAINDCGQIALIGNNLSTGEAGAVLLTRVGWKLVGDLDDDADVDEADLALLLSVFGTEGKLGDLDGDLDVDMADLGLLLSNFGKVCPR